MAGFVEDYFATVTRDPATTWARLTPAFQQSAGGYGTYRGFWSTISSATASGLSADPDALVVTGTVVYVTRDGSRSTERKTFQLARSGDGYLIAGEG